MSAFLYKPPINRLPARVMSAGCVVFAIFSTAAHAAPPPGYRLVWQDEFSGTVLDETKWQYRTDTRYWSTQLPANVSVSNGLLNLHLKKETVGSVNYTAGGVISRNLVRYGYYEALMKVPPGGGWHTSFWMMKYNRPATDTVAIELDVIENDSVTPLKYGVNTHRHLPTPHATFGNKNITTPSLNAGFHLFACEFTPTTIKYFFEGTLVQTVDASQFPHNDLNIWLTSIAAPLGGTTSVDDSQLPAVAQYDYVRFYEPFPAPSVSIISPSSSAVTLDDPSALLRLDASVTAQSGTPTIAWSLVDGPGNVTFSSPADAQTTASFSATGTYTLQCAATNEGGTSTARLHVGVAAPTSIELRQGTLGYQHTATVIRGDQPAWNAGSRDQVLAGRGSAPYRSLFSFDLSPLMPGAVIHEAALDLKTIGGTGTVGALQLRALSATPVEGTGIADGSTGANLGTGTGATWTTRTGGNQAADLWSNAGGDFTPVVLSEIPGFDATVAGQSITLPATPALATTVSAAQAAARPVDLILTATNETLTAAGFVRIASDDATIETDRPALRLSFTGNALPSVTPGPAPAVNAGQTANLNGSATGADTTLWQQHSGPGTVTFADAAQASTTVVFPAPGSYQLKLSGTSPLGTVERILTVEVTAGPPPAVRIQSPATPTVTVADTLTRLHLAASATSSFQAGGPAVSWSQLSGPAPAVFENPLAAETSVSFSQEGLYIFQCSASDAAGSASDEITVAVNTPFSLSFTQGNNGYSHTAAMIRADNPTWNGGARDQLLVGRWSAAAIRAVLSFPLDSLPTDGVIHSVSLDLWTAAVSSTAAVGPLHLRLLEGTPIEGTGNGQSSTAATSGVTWNHRTAQPIPGVAWNTPGGDMTGGALAEVPGHTDPVTHLAVSFPTSPALVTAAQASLTHGTPLDLILVSPSTESSSADALTRLASDDHPTQSIRPRLNLTFTGNFAPAVAPGPPPAAITGMPASLTATATNSTTTWHLVSGPGSAAFANSNTPAITVTFSQPSRSRGFLRLATTHLAGCH